MVKSWSPWAERLLSGATTPPAPPARSVLTRRPGPKVHARYATPRSVYTARTRRHAEQGDGEKGVQGELGGGRSVTQRS